jgi:ketosteroid isomerase-like protein
LNAVAARSATELAQHFFRTLAAKDVDALDDFLHDDVIFAPMMFRDRLYEGHDEVLRGFYDLVFSLPAYRPEASRITELAPNTALVEGRIHFVDDRGSVHDKSAYWVLVFENEQLLSLRGKGSLAEARALAHA